MSEGNFEAVTSALGIQLNELAGLRMTRLTADVAEGATTFPVETTFDWPVPGTFVLDAVTYTYEGKTASTFTGVRWPDVGLHATDNLDGTTTELVLSTVTGTWARFQLTGQFAAVLEFEASVDGLVWTPLSLTPEGGGPPASSATDAGVWTGLVGAAVYVRVRVDSYLTGSIRAALSVFAGQGAKRAHRVASVLVDRSRTYSTLDRVRGQFLVDTAVGDALSALGRNLGVERPPNLTDDDAFRKVIRALAYLPKGTMHGLELALEAFFGAGNFEVWEDFPAHPNTVFVRLAPSVNLVTEAIGQTYLSRREARPLVLPANELTITQPLITVRGVRLADEDRADVWTTVKPTAVTEVRYSGDVGAPAWRFIGTQEALDVAVAPATGVTLANAMGRTAAYARTARIRPESTAVLSAFVRPLSLNSPSDGRQLALQIRDGARDMAVGFVDNGGDSDLGFIAWSTGAFLAGVAATIPAGQHAEVTVRRDPHVGVVELLVDGRVVQTAAAGDFDATTLNEFVWGNQRDTQDAVAEFRVVSLYSSTPTDYWNLRGAGAATNVGQPTEWDTNSAALLAGDLGKALRTISTVPQNNGVWVVASVLDSDRVTLVGPTRPLAFVEAAFAGRISVANTPAAFMYPDDVGKQVTLQGAGPNAGTYTITAVLDETGTPIASGRRGGAAVNVSGAPTWQTEAGLSWNLVPVFLTATGQSWELAGGGAVTPPDTLGLRAAVPLDVPPGYVVIMEPAYTQVESGQLLADPAVPNTANPPGWTWYPAYLPQHPWGPFAAYLDDLTVAGVIPELVF